MAHVSALRLVRPPINPIPPAVRENTDRQVSANQQEPPTPPPSPTPSHSSSSSFPFLLFNDSPSPPGSSFLNDSSSLPSASSHSTSSQSSLRSPQLLPSKCLFPDFDSDSSSTASFSSFDSTYSHSTADSLPSHDSNPSPTPSNASNCCNSSQSSIDPHSFHYGDFPGQLNSSHMRGLIPNLDRLPFHTKDLKWDDLCNMMEHYQITFAMLQECGINWNCLPRDQQLLSIL